MNPVDVEPSENVEDTPLTADEISFFKDRAADLNFFVKELYLLGAPAGTSTVLARATMYAFQMGREYERNNNES